MMKTARRAVIYARFSTELQSARSIDDQITLCREYARRNEYTIVRAYDDRAKTGASILERDGLLRLLADAKNGDFDAVIVEALDRISRDQEDMASIYKKLKFLGIEIIEVHGGKADTIQVGIRGLIGAVYLEDLKHKVRRGMSGRVKDGLSAGGKAYGYRPVLGKPGELVIDAAEAAIVKRIYAEYAAGSSPRDIAMGLNREGVPPPRGTVWHSSALNGNHTRGNGMLRNPIYVGKLIWNRLTMVRDPETGKRVSRPNPESEWQHADVPHLRIIDADLADRVAKRLAGQHERYLHAEYVPRRPRMLSGLLRCGSCGGGMTLDGKTQGKPRIRCVRSHDAGTCDHKRKYTLPAIEEAVLNGLREQLANPAALRLYVDTYLEERRRLAASIAKNRNRIEAQIAKKKAEVDRIIDMAVKGVITIEHVQKRKPELDADISRLEADLAIEPPTKVVDLHPTAIEAFHADIASLASRLTANADDFAPEAIRPLRRLVAAVIVHPSPPFKPVRLEIKGRLAVLLGEEALLPPAKKLAAGLVAEEGFEPPTQGL